MKPNSETNRWGVTGTVLLCILGVTSISSPNFGQSSPQKASANRANSTPHSSDSLIARGKYIVEGLSRCGQCHTPREMNGTADRSHQLQGASVWLKSAEPAEDWPLQAPRIAGIPPGTDPEMIKLLTTGIWRDGKPLRQPMPQFRMTEPDAEAVVAYLKSLE
jgi:mono/diheme cytochrome c family protein